MVRVSGHIEAKRPETTGRLPFFRHETVGVEPEHTLVCIRRSFRCNFASAAWLTNKFNRTPPARGSPQMPETPRPAPDRSSDRIA